MTIYQPRRQNISTFEISKDNLYKWADEVLKPTADLAFAGDGNFLCDEWCGFCKAKHECRARAEANLTLNAVGIVVLEIGQQLQILQVGGNSGVHDSQGERTLVITAGTLHGGVHGGSIHAAHFALGVGDLGDIVGVGIHKRLVLGAGHGEDTLEDVQQGILVNLGPILGPLIGIGKPCR